MSRILKFFYSGQEMILCVINNLNLCCEDIIHIIYNPELDRWGFTDILQKTGHKINYIKLNRQTEGAAETVLYGLSTMDNIFLNKKCVLLDCDTNYNCDILSMYRNCEYNSIFCFKDNQDKPIYSYINIDVQNIVTEIKEKVKISNYANTGCYCFKSGTLLMEYCQKVIDQDIRQNNEYYTSCVIDLMIKNGEKFYANIINENDFNCFGTPLQLKLHCLNSTDKYPKLRICFDLDNTLVTEPQVKGDYNTVLPIDKNIAYLKYLKHMGHEIIIYTARRMRTHGGNLGKVNQDIGNITFKTLKKFGIEYDEIYFGKPYANYYIDDKAINAYSDLEKELGIYDNKVGEREFNQIIMSNIEVVIKKSSSSQINGEIFWYKNIPQDISDLFPAFIKEDGCSYVVEKINGIVLSYLYLEGSLTENILINFLNSVKRIHNSKKIEDNKSINIYENYTKKIKNRYISYDYTKFPNNNYILRN